MARKIYGNHVCPVCGFPYLKDPPDSRSFETCERCGVEFGFDDITDEKDLPKKWKELREFYSPSQHLKLSNDDLVDILLNFSSDFLVALSKKCGVVIEKVWELPELKKQMVEEIVEKIPRSKLLKELHLD